MKNYYNFFRLDSFFIDGTHTSALWLLLAFEFFIEEGGRRGRKKKMLVKITSLKFLDVMDRLVNMHSIFIQSKFILICVVRIKWTLRERESEVKSDPRKKNGREKCHKMRNNWKWFGVGVPLMRFVITLHSTFSAISRFESPPHIKKPNLHSWHFAFDATFSFLCYYLFRCPTLLGPFSSIWPYFTFKGMWKMVRFTVSRWSSHFLWFFPSVLMLVLLFGLKKKKQICTRLDYLNTILNSKLRTRIHSTNVASQSMCA